MKKISKKDDKKQQEPENLEADYYYALSHEIRRKIIKICGDEEFTSFTQLKKRLKVSTGTIYHHLESLSALIEQRKNKKYYLTDLGKHAYDTIQENKKTIEAPDLGEKEFSSPLMSTLMRLTPKRFIEFKDEERTYNIILSISILVLGALLTGLNGFYPLLLFFIGRPEDVYELEMLHHFLLSIGFIVNFLIYFGLVELICRLLYRKSENVEHFFLSFSLIFYPMVIYLLIHFILLSTELLLIGVVRFIDTILLIFFQILSLWLLTYIISVNKGLKIENGLIISLFLHYGSFSLILFTSI